MENVICIKVEWDTELLYIHQTPSQLLFKVYDYKKKPHNYQIISILHIYIVTKAVFSTGQRWAPCLSRSQPALLGYNEPFPQADLV